VSGRRLALAVCSALLVLAPAAPAQGPPGPTTNLTFGSVRPNTPTLVEVSAATNQGAVGPSLEAFTATLPPGTDIDDSFIPNCGLSLQQFLTQTGGANNCPSSSLIGEAELVLRYATGGTSINEVSADFNLYNTPGAGFVGTFPVSQIVSGGTGNYVVNGVFRGPASSSGGPRINLNSIPGPPSASTTGVQSAYVSAELQLFPRARGSSDFIVTPGRCTPGGVPNRWSMSTSILVSGGTKYQVQDTVPCVPGPPARD